MSIECLKNCPRIVDLRNMLESELFDEERFPGATDISETKRLLREARQDALNCAGPQTCERQVKKGIFRKKTVTEIQTVCGLDKK